jgi:hypothetical protein
MGLVEREEPVRPGAAGDDAWRTMSDADLAKRMESLQMRTKALHDLVDSATPSAREVDREKMTEAYPEMQKAFAAVVADWNALTA